jgi:hypothetical protein
VVRFWKDMPGQEKRMHVRQRICPISGPGLLSKSERKRKAREIIQASGAVSAEYFTEVVKQETGVLETGARLPPPSGEYSHGYEDWRGFCAPQVLAVSDPAHPSGVL